MKTIKIIIADDHQLFREGLELILKKSNFNFKIHHAKTGKEVLELLQGNSVDVIIMDIRMPVMDGIETTKRIRQEKLKVKIIALSMFEDPSSIVRMFIAGANGYLLKNIDSEEIIVAINTVMNNQYFVTERAGNFFNEGTAKSFHFKETKDLREELSEREKEILVLIYQQFSTKEISDKLNLSEKTVEIHRLHIMEKTHSKNMIGLALYAIEKGLIQTNS